MQAKYKLIIIAVLTGVALIVLIILGAINSLFSTINGEEEATGNFIPQSEIQANAYQIYQKALAEGGTPESACDLLGVMQHESGLNPSRIQSDASYNASAAMNPTVGGYAFGLPQWDGGRRVALLNYATEQSKEWSDLTLQIEFMFYHDSTDSTLLKSILADNNTLGGSIKSLVDDWERAGVKAYETRLAYAQVWYELIVNQQGGFDLGGISSEGIPNGYETKVSPKPTGLVQPGNLYSTGQCTWGAYNRVHELGSDFPWLSGSAGNGGFWYTVTEAMGYATQKGTPKNHWIVCFPPGVAGSDKTYGHVAVIGAKRF